MQTGGNLAEQTGRDAGRDLAVPTERHSTVWPENYLAEQTEKHHRPKKNWLPRLIIVLLSRLVENRLSRLNEIGLCRLDDIRLCRLEIVRESRLEGIWRTGLGSIL